ncbi:hypothetical protein ACLB2K_002390 [Fragaria x ananassa]
MHTVFTHNTYLSLPSQITIRFRSPENYQLALSNNLPYFYSQPQQSYKHTEKRKRETSTKSEPIDSNRRPNDTRGTILDNDVADLKNLSWQESSCITAINTLSSYQQNDAVECTNNDRKRQIEPKLVDLEDKLTDQGFTDDEVRKTLEAAAAASEDMGGPTAIVHAGDKKVSDTQKEIWDALGAAAEADLSLAQAIVDSAGFGLTD